MELDMEIGEGQPQGCPFFGGGDGSDDFGESTLPVCLLEADRQLVVAVRRKSSYIT